MQTDPTKLADLCESCGGLNISCPNGCERDPATGELLIMTQPDPRDVDADKWRNLCAVHRTENDGRGKTLSWSEVLCDRDGPSQVAHCADPDDAEEIVAALLAATTITALQADVADLRLALGWALGKLIAYEPGDSRAVSNEFVAAASIEAGLTDRRDECRALLAALGQQP